MKKVGIITFHSADNYGAVLQAFALMDTIKKMDFEVELINFSPVEIRNPYTLFPNFRYTLSQRGILRTIKDYLMSITKYKDNQNRIKNFNKFREEFLKIGDGNYLNSSELLSNPPKYDYYITGSDQVWNPDFFLDIGGSYFLDFVTGSGRKISYAASIAKAPDTKYSKYFERYLSDFDYISVREKTAKEFIEESSNKEVYVTVDPTLLVSQERWKEVSTTNFVSEKYILVYDLIKDPVTVALANKVAKEYNCKIISYSNSKGYDNWHGSFANENPTEFLGLFEKAEFVITSSFHGTAFAVIFNKPFYTIPHPTRGSRMIDLLNDLGISDRIVKQIEDLEHIEENIDYESVNQKILEIREYSIEYLKNALGSGN